MSSRSRRQDHRTSRLGRSVLGAVLLAALAGSGGCKKLSESLGSRASTPPAASAAQDSAPGIGAKNALPPKVPALEQLGTRFVVALETLRPILDEARKYYENRDYKNDKS